MKKYVKNCFKGDNVMLEFINKIRKNEKNQKIFAVVAGGIAGLINGLFGGGGGMIIVPMLINFLNCPEKKAHATAILIILPLSITSGLFYLSFGALNLSVAIPTTIGVVVGGGVGALLLSKLSGRWVTIIFSVVMAVAGIKMLFF